MAGPRGTDATLGWAPAAPFSGQGQPCPEASIWSAVECRILFLRVSSQPLNSGDPPSPRTRAIGPFSPKASQKGAGGGGALTQPPSQKLKARHQAQVLEGQEGRKNPALPFMVDSPPQTRGGALCTLHTPGHQRELAGKRATRTTRAPGAFKETLPLLRRALERQGTSPSPSHPCGGWDPPPCNLGFPVVPPRWSSGWA